jgi:hypothetical protein
MKWLVAEEEVLERVKLIESEWGTVGVGSLHQESGKIGSLVLETELARTMQGVRNQIWMANTSCGCVGKIQGEGTETERQEVEETGPMAEGR